MKWNFFGKKHESKEKESDCGCISHKICETADCECGCSQEARDSVKLTDAEIAEDILCELTEICNEYKCLCKDGCECSEKLESCKKSREKLCEFIQNNK